MAKQEFRTKCPACGNEMTGSICQNCGYVRIIFPTAVPESIKSFEHERINAIRSIQRKIEEQRESLSEEIENLKSELERCKQKNANNKTSTLKGIILIEDTRNNIFSIAPVNNGANTYGSDPDNGNQHKISFRIRGFAFKPRHFKVSTTSEGFELEPCQGVTIWREGGGSITSANAGMADKFLLDENGNVRINILKL